MILDEKIASQINEKTVGLEELMMNVANTIQIVDQMKDRLQLIGIYEDSSQGSHRVGYNNGQQTAHGGMMLSYQNTSEQVSSGTRDLKNNDTIELIPRAMIERNPHLFLFSSSSSTSDLPEHRNAEPYQVISFIESGSDDDEPQQEIQVDIAQPRIKAAPLQPKPSIDQRAFEDPSILNTRFLTTSNNQNSSNQFWKNMLGGGPGEQTYQSLFRSNEEIPSTIAKGPLTNNFFQASEFLPRQHQVPINSVTSENDIQVGSHSLRSNKHLHFSEGDEDDSQMIDEDLIQIDAQMVLAGAQGEMVESVIRTASQNSM